MDTVVVICSFTQFFISWVVFIVVKHFATENINVLFVTGQFQVVFFHLVRDRERDVKSKTGATSV